jgi:RNA recognition motif-containing protein
LPHDDTTYEWLRQLFSAHGEVTSVNVVTDRYTGPAKGFGLVEMTSEEEAKAAIAALKGREVDGRQLRVNEAMERPRDCSGDLGEAHDRW